MLEIITKKRPYRLFPLLVMLYIAISGLSGYELILMAVICAAGIIIGLIPGYRFYRCSLSDDLTNRL